MKPDIYHRIQSMTDEMELIARKRRREYDGAAAALDVALDMAEKIRKGGVTENIHSALVEAEKEIKDREPYIAALMFLLAKDFKTDLQRQKSLQMN